MTVTIFTLRCTHTIITTRCAILGNHMWVWVGVQVQPEAVRFPRAADDSPTHPHCDHAWRSGSGAMPKPGRLSRSRSLGEAMPKPGRPAIAQKRSRTRREEPGDV